MAEENTEVREVKEVKRMAIANLTSNISYLIS